MYLLCCTLHKGDRWDCLLLSKMRKDSYPGKATHIIFVRSRKWSCAVFTSKAMVSFCCIVSLEFETLWNHVKPYHNYQLLPKGKKPAIAVIAGFSCIFKGLRAVWQVKIVNITVSVWHAKITVFATEMHTNLHMCIGDLPQRLLRSDSPTDRQTGSCAQPWYDRIPDSPCPMKNAPCWPRYSAGATPERSLRIHYSAGDHESGTQAAPAGFSVWRNACDAPLGAAARRRHL